MDRVEVQRHPIRPFPMLATLFPLLPRPTFNNSFLNGFGYLISRTIGTFLAPMIMIILILIQTDRQTVISYKKLSLILTIKSAVPYFPKAKVFGRLSWSSYCNSLTAQKVRRAHLEVSPPPSMLSQ